MPPIAAQAAAADCWQGAAAAAAAARRSPAAGPVLTCAPHPPLLLRPCSIWDDGTANPEPALDQFTLVGKYQALGWLAGGFGVYGLVGFAASALNTTAPWVSFLCAPK